MERRGRGAGRAGESGMSNLLNAVADEWPKVRAKASGHWILPDLQKRWVNVTASKSLPIGAAESATLERQAVAAAESDRGWLRYRSDSFDGERWSAERADKGPLLWAEWADDTGSTSYRLVPDGTGGIVCRTYRESDTPKDGWTAVLAENAILQGHSNGRDLVYRVYWGAGTSGDPSEIRRLFARFVGFTERSK